MHAAYIKTGEGKKLCGFLSFYKTMKVLTWNADITEKKIACVGIANTNVFTHYSFRLAM